MQMIRGFVTAASVCVILWTGGANAAMTCTGKGVEVQVLGSGGPELTPKRASSSYLVWQGGRPRVLVDAGGGSALRFGEAGAHVADLDVVLFSHLHVDHSADFPALIKASYFEKRDRPLPVYGPAGNAHFPATTAFVADLFDSRRGAYRYLGAFLQGQEEGYKLQAKDIAPKAGTIAQVMSADGLKISATSLIHGNVPALGWRVEIDGKVIVFSGDTAGADDQLQKLAKDADIFIAHNAIPEDAPGPIRKLHMPPSVIGNIAGVAGVKSLVLSHRMSRSLGHEDETRTVIAKTYQGPLAFADDLDCFG